MAESFAPIFYQASDGVGDRISGFGFDGDMVAGNNWDNLNYFPKYAKVYYALVETTKHYFITYSVFHPRDWCDQDYGNLCAWQLDSYHENDLEGARLVVDKTQTDAASPLGKVVYAEAAFHLDLLRYPNSTSWSVGSTGGSCTSASDVRYDAEVVATDNVGFRSACLSWEQDAGGFWRPVFFIEARGHGVASLSDTDKIGFWPSQNFPGYIYIPGTVGQDPGLDPFEERYTYELAWIDKREYYPETWGLWGYRLFGTETYRYVGETSFNSPTVGPYGLRWGREFPCEGSGQCGPGARAAPPWAWPAAADTYVGMGTWFNHPAWAMALSVDAPFVWLYQGNKWDHSYYITNPFLDEQDAPGTPSACSPGGGGGGLEHVQAMGAAGSDAELLVNVRNRPKPQRFARELEWIGPALGQWSVRGESTSAVVSASLARVDDARWGGSDGASDVIPLAGSEELGSPTLEASSESYLEVVLRYRANEGRAVPVLSWERRGGTGWVQTPSTEVVRDRDMWTVASALLWEDDDWFLSQGARRLSFSFPALGDADTVWVQAVIVGH